MNKYFLFTAKVTAVYPNGKYETVGGKKNVVRNAYTIDANPTILCRQLYVNIPVMRPISGGSSGGTGFVWMPNVNDLVVCGFVEGHDSLPVCIGTINSPNTQSVTSEGNTLNDCTLHHITGSFIRMRNPGGDFSSSEIEINHNRGTTITIATNGDITIRGSGDITISDTNTTINCDGDATVKASGTVQLNAPKIELGAAATEHLIKGDLFKSFYDQHKHMTGVGPSSMPMELMATRTDLLSTISTTE